MSKKSYLNIRGEWYCGDSLKVTLTADMLPADDLVRQIEKKIKSLRSVYDEFIVIDLQNYDNPDHGRPLFFQTVKNRMFHATQTYLVELGIWSPQGNILYRKDEIDLSSVLSLFQRFCVDRERPNPSEWEVITQYGSNLSDEERARCDKCNKFIHRYWRDETDDYGTEFDEYAALEYLTQNNNDPFYFGELVRIYERKGLYKKIRALFDDSSYHPVVAQINGEMALHGIFGKPDYKKAYDYFTHAMKIGSLLAEYYIAKMYQYGLYVKQSDVKYKRMIRAVYNKYARTIIECCPNQILLEMSRIELIDGNVDAAAKICLNALNVHKKMMSYGTNIITKEESDIINQLYRIIDFDPDDMDLLDLLYTLQKPCTVCIVIDGEQIIVRSYYDQDRLIVKCGEEYYRDAVEFLQKYKIGGDLLSEYIYNVDYMEIV